MTVKEGNMAKRLFVGNLSWDINDDEFKKMFEPFGEIISAEIVKDRATNRSRGFGFVEFATEEAATNAKQGMNGKEIKGRTIKVDTAQETRKR
jgi:RNA recognition motif-containing protein